MESLQSPAFIPAVHSQPSRQKSWVEPLCGAQKVTIGALWLPHVTANGDMVSLVNDVRVIDEGCDWTNTNTLRTKITRIINKLRGGKERSRILDASIADQRKLLNSMLREEYKSVPQKKKGARGVVKATAHGGHAGSGSGAGAAVAVVSPCLAAFTSKPPIPLLFLFRNQRQGEHLRVQKIQSLRGS